MPSRKITWWRAYSCVRAAAHISTSCSAPSEARRGAAEMALASAAALPSSAAGAEGAALPSGTLARTPCGEAAGEVAGEENRSAATVGLGSDNAAEEAEEAVGEAGSCAAAVGEAADASADGRMSKSMRPAGGGGDGVGLRGDIAGSRSVCSVLSPSPASGVAAAC